MSNYFNIKFEFNHREFEKLVSLTGEKSKGYCCFIDLTSLVYSYRNLEFRNVLNGALSNSCDGSYIALYASKIHK